MENGGFSWNITISILNSELKVFIGEGGLADSIIRIGLVGAWVTFSLLSLQIDEGLRKRTELRGSKIDEGLGKGQNKGVQK